MKLNHILLYILGLCVTTPHLGLYASAAEQDEVSQKSASDSKVVVLTSDNFDSVIKENNHVLVCSVGSLYLWIACFDALAVQCHRRG
jgi:hypothetical protein